MYVIKADGQMIFSSALLNNSQMMNPMLTLEVNRAGNLTFTLPSGSPAKNSLQKLKTIVTVEQDGAEVFRGRVTEETTDIDNLTEYYCEGELSFLLDSITRPYKFEGKVVEYITTLIANHNALVDEDKRFTVGRITAVNNDVVLGYENVGYSDTFTEIEGVLLDVYGGYLQVRHEGGTRYLDYLREIGNSTEASIEFGLNMIDYSNQVTAQDVYTVLIPLGATQGDGMPLTIQSVNNGLDYIEDAEGVAKYGRIWKAFEWDQVTEPAKLLEVAREQLQNVSTVSTLILTAVDMRLVDGNARAIGLGDAVHLVSTPHNINKHAACTAMEIDIQNPEDSRYTFGPPIQTLSDRAVSMARMITKQVGYNLRHIKETETAVKINIEHLDNVESMISEVNVDIDALNAAILLKASRTDLEENNLRLTAAEVAIDGANAAIALKASQQDVTALTRRVSEAEISIDGANAAIELKASQQDVTDLTNRISSAEISIDGANAEIELKVNKNGVISSINQSSESVTIKASKINLSGYVTASQLSAELADFELAWSDTVATRVLSVSKHAGIVSMTYDGSEINKKSRNVVTEVTFPTLQGTTINYVDANGVSHSQFVTTGFATSSRVTKDTFYYLGY